MVNYCNLSIILGAILLASPLLSIPIPQLRVLFGNMVVSGGAGVVLIALGILLGAIGICV